MYTLYIHIYIKCVVLRSFVHRIKLHCDFMVFDNDSVQLNEDKRDTSGQPIAIHIPSNIIDCRHNDSPYPSGKLQLILHHDHNLIWLCWFLFFVYLLLFMCVYVTMYCMCCAAILIIYSRFIVGFNIFTKLYHTFGLTSINHSAQCVPSISPATNTILSHTLKKTLFPRFFG